MSPAAVALYCYRTAARALSLRLLTLELLAVSAGAPGSLLPSRGEELSADHELIERVIDASGRGGRGDIPGGAAGNVGAVAICRYIC